MNTCSANLQLLHRRKRYLAFRILMLAILLLILSFHPGSASVMEPGSFLSEFSLLHLFWFMWMIYLITKLLPWKKLHNRSEYRQFAAAFIARIPYPTPEVIRKHVRRANLQALKSAVAWLALTFCIWGARSLHFLHEKGLLVLSGIFYVCDLICVIYYCPFQHLLMQNSCCNTCRIHNWDAIMMFTPMAFTKGFFGLSLFAMAALVFLFWEIRFLLHPERFLQITNANITCVACTDHLCKIR